VVKLVIAIKQARRQPGLFTMTLVAAPSCQPTSTAPLIYFLHRQHFFRTWQTKVIGAQPDAKYAEAMPRPAKPIKTGHAQYQDRQARLLLTHKPLPTARIIKGET